MQGFEKLGVFYLGKEYDLLGGKTGLEISRIEEAAIDKIPVLAIDPKWDLGNLT